MSKPLVSIIIPAYNAEDYLEETIQSALNQTYDNIEIFIINDGSTDHTAAIAGKFKDFATLINQSNQGVSVARNIGLQNSKGRYISFLDADDWYYPTNIEEKVDLLEANPEIGIAHSLLVVTDEKLQPTGKIIKGKKGDVFNDFFRLSPPPIPCPSNALIRRDILPENPFDPNLSTTADIDLWFRLAQITKVERVDEPLVKYRQHNKNMFSNIELQVRDMEYMFEKYDNAGFPLKKWTKYKGLFYYSIAGAYFNKSNYTKFIKYYFKYLSYSFKSFLKG